MSNVLIIGIVLLLGAIGFFLGRGRALSSAGGNARNLHSLPVYYGANVGLNTIVPAFGILILWLLAQPLFIKTL